MELKFYGNREPIELIRRMVCKNREQRSILIHGEKGLGKKHLAKYIAAAYLCREHDGVPCGECKSCRMIMHGTHPDIINVKANANGNYIIDRSYPTAQLCPTKADIKSISYLILTDR